MAIYTCFDMIRDCREGKAQGWRFFASNFIAPLRTLLRHYAGTADVEAFLRSLLHDLREKDGGFFAALSPAPERQFLMLLRPRVLAVTENMAPRECALRLETLTAALRDYSPVERQITWMETMSYDIAGTAALMRVSEETVQRLRRRTGELLRAHLDRWSETTLRDNGRALGQAAAAEAPEHAVQFRELTDLIDGRTTWQGRQELEPRLVSSWHNLGLLCSLREADAAISQSKPLGESEVAPYLKLLDVPAARGGFWSRLVRPR